MKSIKTTSTSLFALTLAAVLVTGCLPEDKKDPVTDPVTDPVEEEEVLSYDPATDANLAKGWTLMWQDEFDGESIDTSKWSHEVNCWGGGNAEDQCYTDRPVNSYVEDGVLTLAGIKEEFSGPAVNDDDDAYDPSDMSVTMPYTSARMRTKYKGDWTYGRIEVKAKPPVGQGSFPAVWMLPTDWEYGGWAASGEIDIVEWPNMKATADDDDHPEITEEARVHGTLHYGAAFPNNRYSGAHTYLEGFANPADDFHVYAVEWEEGEIRWLVDGVHYATQTSDDWYSQYEDENGDLAIAPDAAPFDQDFHIILNNAVGGNWPEGANDGGIDETIERRELQIEYVRVYQCSVDMVTGVGCGTINPDAEDVVGHQPPVVVEVDSTEINGPVYTLFDDDINEALIAWEYDPDGNVLATEVAETDRGEVLQIDKTGAGGNFYFANVELDENSNPLPLDSDVQGWLENGVLKFDMKVLNNDAGSTVNIKMDSGWPNVSDYTLTLPAVGVWTSIEIPLADIFANGNANGCCVGQANPASLTNALVFEPSGAISFQLDDIVFDSTSMDTDAAELVFYEDFVNEPFALGQWNGSGNVVIEEVAAADTTYGQVVQMTFNTDQSVAYFQSGDNGVTNFDATGFDNVEFDLLVVTDERSTRVFTMKVDCGYPCSSGDFPIDTPEVGVWTHYSVALEDMLAANHAGSSLNLATVNTPLVIFPAMDNQNGVVMQVDNVKFTKNP